MVVSLHVLVLLVLAALLAGWVDAVVGGGGLVQLPALVVALPPETGVATLAGTNKVPAASGTLVASLTYLRSVGVQWASALPLVTTAALGSSLGATLARHLPKRWFLPIVLLVLVVVGTHTLRRPELGLVHRPRHSGVHQAWRLAVVGSLIGLYDGMVGPGTGTFFVLALVCLLGHGFLQASVLAKLANLATNAAAIGVFWHSGAILWPLALCMAAANLTGGLVGARMAVRRGSAFVRKVFLVVVAGLGTKLAHDTLLAFGLSPW